MRVKFFAVLILVAGVLGGAQPAAASVESIFLSRETTINPETGEAEHRLLNPSGEVTLTYTNAGLQLEFVNQQKQMERIQIYVEFPAMPEDGDDERRNIRNEVIDGILQNRGKIMAGQLLRLVVAKYVANEQRLTLLLDTSGVAGFNKNQISMSRVRLTGPDEPPTALDRILSKMVSQKAEAQAAEQMQTKNRKNPVGFMWGLPRAEVGGPKPAVMTCEGMFGQVK